MLSSSRAVYWTADSQYFSLSCGRMSSFLRNGVKIQISGIEESREGEKNYRQDGRIIAVKPNMRCTRCTNKSPVVFRPLRVQLERVLELHGELTMHCIGCTKA